MKHLRTEILIDAPPALVWQILCDFPSYPDWNPFIIAVEGKPEPGARLVVRLKPPGGKAMTFKPVLKQMKKPESLRWLGHLLIPGLFDGEHIFELAALDTGGVRLRHGEDFAGLLVPLLWNRLEEPTLRGFEAMNQALKERAELRAQA